MERRVCKALTAITMGGGFDIALTPQMAFQVAYRFRHYSNAGIYKENFGFNVHFFQAGLNYYY